MSLYSSTVENYIKCIFLTPKKPTAGFVPMKKLADEMKVSPGTVTAMMKTLSESDLVEYIPRKGCSLTEKGRTLALDVLRKHRLVELFLVKVLGIDWSEVHEDADMLEHVISDRVLDRIDAVLNYPRFGPHGNPIPGSDGQIPERALSPLNELSVGKSARIALIEETDPEFLRYAKEMRLLPNMSVSVSNRDIQAGTITINTEDSGQSVLAISAAKKILVDSQG